MDVKPPSTYKQQVDKLISRGCEIEDRSFAEEILRRINYYRLTAYFLPFKNEDGTYKKGTSFLQVYQIYEFDRKMRNLLFPVIEEIELMLRTQLAYFHAHKYGPLGYENSQNFNKFHKHDRFMKHVQDSIRNNDNQLFVQHHKKNYDGKFPIWVVLELASFGELSFFYSDLLAGDKKEIARELFGTVSSNVSSWLMCITNLRNYCAHYARLYYSIFPAKPATPKNHSYVLNRRLFDYILVLSFLYRDKLRWNNRFVLELESLIHEYEHDINLKCVGFPENWQGMLTFKKKNITGTILLN